MIIFFHVLFLLCHTIRLMQPEKKIHLFLRRCRTNYGFTMSRYMLPKLLNILVCDHLNDISSLLRNAFL
ncbi:uncharacterized protein ISCGN_005835 [Ixodes scapularis]